MGTAAAAIDAGVDAGPVVQRNRRHYRRLVEREISGTGGSDRAE